MRKTILKIDLVLDAGGGSISCLLSGCRIPDSLRMEIEEWSKGVARDMVDRLGIVSAVSEVLRAAPVEGKI